MKTKTRVASKCREWEKLRRDKLKKNFETLSKLLPDHDPSLVLSKIDILKKAAIYIEELQQKLKDVLTGEAGVKKTESEEIKALYECIKKLLTRNEQLSNLLKDAGIRIPSEYGSIGIIANFKEPLRWSKKITPEQAKKLSEKEAQKENEKETNNLPKKKSENKDSSPQKIETGLEQQKKDKKKCLKKAKTKKLSVVNVNLSKITTVIQTITKPSQPCFIIASNSTRRLIQTSSKVNKAASTVVTNSSLLSAPKVASVIAPPSSAVVSKVNAKLSSLGPGTLILANGNVVPILPPQPTTILTNPAPILLKPPCNNTTFIVMPTKHSKDITSVTKSTNAVTTSVVAVSSNATLLSTSKTFKTIKPKIGVTRTTQVNKVPIPALTSKYSNLSPVKTIASSDASNNKKVTNIEASKKRKLTSKATSEKLNDEKRLKADDTLQSESVAKDKVVVTTANAVESSSLSNLKNNEYKNTKTDCSVRKATSTTDNLDNTIPIAAEVNIESKTKTVVENGDHDNKNINEKANDIVVIKGIDDKNEKSSKSQENLKSQLKDESSQNEDNDGGLSLQKADLSKNSSKIIEANGQSSDSDIAKITTTTITIATTSASTTVSNSSTITTTETSSTKSTVSVATTQEIQDKNLELSMNLNHSELSNDIFSSLQVPIGGQNPESTSPTAAFLLAFPLVSSLTGVKVTEVIEEENPDSRHGTPTLLQIGTMDTTKTTQSIHTESLTPNLLNLDNFSFFSSISANQTLEQNSKSSNCDKPQEVLESVKKIQEKNPIPIELPTTTKATVISHNHFVRQNSSISYSKPSSSLYLPEPSLIQYDGRQKISNTNTAISMNRKNQDPIQTTTTQYNNTPTSNTVSAAQCNTYNPFSDFSKPVHSYATFSKPYNDPLYTNSSHYNYPQNNTANTFDQNVYYPSKSASSSSSSKPNNIMPYGTTSTYSETQYGIDCKTKRDSTNHNNHTSINTNSNNNNSNSINYYNHNNQNTSKNQSKEKFPSHSSSTKASKSTNNNNNHPKPPINWMTTPDFRSQPTNTDYLVPAPFPKDIDYNPNAFYPSNSFVSTTHTSYFNATSTMYSTPEFHQNAIMDNRKTFDSSLPIISSTNSVQRSEFEENQFSWSPTKLPQFLETPHSFVSSTLPTLVGDLALGTTQPTFNEQKVEQTTVREHAVVKSKDNNRRPKVHPVNYDHNQSNFLSVSQLVENKTDLSSGGSSSRTTNRRNNSNRNTKNNNSHKGNKHSNKTTEHKELLDNTNQIDASNMEKKQTVNYMQGLNNGNSNNWLENCSNKPRHSHKNPQSSYSAEALIGHQDQSDSILPKQRYRQQQTNYGPVNKTIPIPSFLSDNIVPYFPPVEIPQDNNFMQANSNYQSSSLTHSFPTAVQSNSTYPTGTFISSGSATITSSYLQTSALIHEFGTHDYNATPDNSIIADKVTISKHCNSRSDGVNKQTTNSASSRTEDRSNIPHQINTDCSANASNFMKKTKNKHANENNLPGIVDFGFLSMPNTINSPILPDDFHAHSNFLPPPTPSQLYSCKNPLYTKQPTDLNSSSLLPLPPVPVSRGTSQHFEGTTPNASSSLTSFNLSAIFPEINKAAVPLPGLYSSEPSRNKNYNFQRNYVGSGSVQVSFNNTSKSTSSSYVNTVPTSYAPSN